MSFGYLVEKWKVVPQKRIMRPFLKNGGISPFLYAKATPCSLTSSILLQLILLNAPHACSHLLFPESAPFHSPTEHKKGTNPFYFLAQTKHKSGANPFFRSGTMTLRSTWFPNQTHPKCFSFSNSLAHMVEPIDSPQSASFYLPIYGQVFTCLYMGKCA
jgi:hypothetical protein